MIQAKSLRLGNWYLENNNPVQVSEIRDWYFGDAEEILLTADVLLKCKCRKEDESFYNEAGEKIHKSDSFYFKFNNAKAHVRYLYDTNEVLCWINYEMNDRPRYNSDELFFYNNQFIFRRNDLTLHEFQNIVYSLTGNEIEVSW